MRAGNFEMDRTPVPTAERWAVGGYSGTINVMPGHSRPKDGVASARPGIHVVWVVEQKHVDGRDEAQP